MRGLQEKLKWMVDNKYLSVPKNEINILETATSSLALKRIIEKATQKN